MEIRIVKKVKGKYVYRRQGSQKEKRFAKLMKKIVMEKSRRNFKRNI